MTPVAPHMRPATPNPADAEIRRILAESRRIALVGASDNPARAANGVMAYLLGAGYEVVPVNPRLAGGTVLGHSVVASLADVPGPIDIVDIFRRRDALSGVVDAALALDPLPRVIWMQLGLRDDAAAERARAAGVRVVMDRCMKVEHARLA